MKKEKLKKSKKGEKIKKRVKVYKAKSKNHK